MVRPLRMFKACSNLFARSRGALAVGGIVAAAVAGACTASLDFTECTVDADCDRFEAGEPLRCDTNRCVPATCSNNSECEGLGGSQVCGLDDFCVDALVAAGVDDDCEFLVLPGNSVKDKLTLIGAVYNGDSAIGALAEASFKLAVEDFNAGTTMANGNAVGVVACNSAGDPEQASAAAKHLAEVVGVPAILGPLDDDDFVEVANKVSVVPGNLIFTMTPTAVAPTGESDSGVLWRTIPGADYQGKALRARLLGGGFGSVIMVFRGDNYGLGLYEALTEDNGMGQRVIPGIGNQSNLSYGADENGAGQLDTLLGVIPEPEAIVLLGGDEVGEQLKHIADLGVAPKKIYISHAGLRGIQGALLETGDAALAGRIELIAPVSEHPDNKTVLYTRLQERNPNVILGTEAPLSYDAAMTTLLAMRAIGDGKTLTGPVIAQQMSRLTSGAPISFGDVESLAFVKDAANALGSGGSIDMIGNSGELGFVLAKGQPCSPFVSWGFTDVASPVPVQLASYATACPDATGTWAE
ncbi:MAG: ABC transporter substrate-binding protein [Myxococcales bacterium]|nr:ABC transporter substrate-binding protein [Myxococcales bacterium]